MGEALLTVEQLSCERDGRRLIQDMCFHLAAGELLQVEGANGSGKTTLLRILCGLYSEYTGTVAWRQRPIQEVRAEYLTQLLYSGHASGLKAALTAAENLRCQGALQGHASAQSIAEALANVGLVGFEDVPCYTLSAGQQRRVGLARLQLSQAALWILDEPFTAIDKQGVQALEQVLLNHSQAGGSVIFSTHHELSLATAVTRLNLDEIVK